MAGNKKPKKQHNRMKYALKSHILLPDQVAKYVMPMHIGLELLPLGLFGRSHADHLAMCVNLVAVDSAGSGNGMRGVADRAADVLLTMYRRVREGKSWNVTADERRVLMECITKMDRYMRTWTSARLLVAAKTIALHNDVAKAKGGKFLDRIPVAEVSEDCDVQGS